jgi:hypothetical protein
MNEWIATAQALPRHGDTVEFVVERRATAIQGRFENSAFLSRWSCYSPADISEWRMIAANPAMRTWEPSRWRRFQRTSRHM